MSFTTKGKVFEKGQITEGVSASGTTWQRMTLVIDVQYSNFSKKVAFQVMTGNVPSVMAFNIGDSVEVGWDISSREYTNKDGVRSWFTQADLRSIKAADGVPASTAPAAPAEQRVPLYQQAETIKPVDQDLPF
jgi:hypothetical protein